MKNITKIFLLSSLLLGMMFSSCNNQQQCDDVTDCVDKVESGVHQISVEELKVEIDNNADFYLIDVREAREYFPGYIPTAISMSSGILPFVINKKSVWEAKKRYVPEKSSVIVLYCKKGARSILAADLLMRMGYTNVKYLKGGWQAWEITYPLEYDKQLKKLNGEEKKEAPSSC
ncbi:MAG: rhodanese-like domain-containing protein [Bacteroidota bacterium]|nr:rhodanese-like domain-containing protein [Bacteroidota bacterium]